jgi:hypothetical protein
MFFRIIDKGFGTVFGGRRADSGNLREVILFAIPEASFSVRELAIKGVKGVGASLIIKSSTQG